VQKCEGKPARAGMRGQVVAGTRGHGVFQRLNFVQLEISSQTLSSRREQEALTKGSSRLMYGRDIASYLVEAFSLFNFWSLSPTQPCKLLKRMQMDV
jgi:hypothetical protein